MKNFIALFIVFFVACATTAPTPRKLELPPSGDISTDSQAIKNRQGDWNLYCISIMSEKDLLPALEYNIKARQEISKGYTQYANHLSKPEDQELGMKKKMLRIDIVAFDITTAEEISSAMDSLSDALHKRSYEVDRSTGILEEEKNHILSQLNRNQQSFDQIADLRHRCHYHTESATKFLFEENDFMDVTMVPFRQTLQRTAKYWHYVEKKSLEDMSLNEFAPRH